MSARGWATCPRCEGSGDFVEDSMSALGIPGGWVITGPCPDCADGLVRSFDHAEGIRRATDAYLEAANRTIDQVVEAVIAAYLGDA